MPIEWKKLDDQNSVVVPAKPATGLWTLVRTFVGNSQIIRIEAEGQWKPVSGLDLPCGADGLRHWIFGRDQLLCKKAPLGALIGKIGGSNISTDDSEIFLVGSVAVLICDKAAGPLYLTINDAPGCFDDISGALSVTIS
jgi:PA-IL-like protein